MMQRALMPVPTAARLSFGSPQHPAKSHLSFIEIDTLPSFAVDS
jgi:hypothetical protein